MKQLNLSEWALNHRSLIAYFMIVAGVLSYFRLGRNEDPSFTYAWELVVNGPTASPWGWRDRQNHPL